MGVLDELLNKNSQLKKADVMHIDYISYTDISANEKNKSYSVDGIDELKQNILLNGLEQPLVVKKENGKYILLTGHRRFFAMKELIKSNEIDSPLIPCIVKNPNENNLPISDYSKEMLSILSTNLVREKTQSDLMFEVAEWKKIFNELRDNGVEYVDFLDKKINGIKTRELISEATGLSQGQISKIENIENNASEDIKEDIKKGKLSINQASELISDDNKYQKTLRKFYNEMKKVIKLFELDEVMQNDMYRIYDKLEERLEVLKQ